MHSRPYLDEVQKVRGASDEELQAFWLGSGRGERDGSPCTEEGRRDWHSLVVSELIYRGFCFRRENGKECADRGTPVAEMCPGCRGYWVGAAEMVGKTAEAWIAECAA